jgi:excisionase family DNA binding protein
MEGQHLSLSEVAGLMGVSERTVRRWIKSGKLRAYKPGRDYRIPESAVRAFVEDSEISPKAFRRSSLEPTLFNGLEGERREAIYDIALAAARGQAERGHPTARLLQGLRERGDSPFAAAPGRRAGRRPCRDGASCRPTGARAPADGRDALRRSRRKSPECMSVREMKRVPDRQAQDPKTESGRIIADASN